jgi:hypothetical protein
VKPHQAVSLIEAAYRIDLSTEEWLERISAAGAAALGSNQGAMAFRYDATGDDWIHLVGAALHGLPPTFAQDFFNQPDLPPEDILAISKMFRSLRFGTLRPFIEQQRLSTVAGVLDRYGVRDMVGANGLDPAGRGCMLLIADQSKPLSSRTVHLWHRLAAHIAAGNRLRATLEGIAQTELDLVRSAQAIIAANGKVEHATGSAEPRSAREALRDALARIDAARAEKDDVRRSVDLWRALVAGEWSLIEHFERDGRRYYLAHKNDPELGEDRALTLRERQVLGYAKLGNSNKLIAYSLGISSSTVSTLLGRARKKLGVQS